MSGARRIRRSSGRRGSARLRGLEVAMEAAAAAWYFTFSHRILRG
jgi:hypothetical protein